MKVYTLEAEMWLPLDIETVFAFFSDAANLEALTPPWLYFHILTPAPITMHAGTLIDYRLKVHGLPLNWRSEITVWQPPHQFVDEQRRGPYRLWKHRHDFEPRDGGTLLSDHVEYAVPGWVLAGWLQRWFVGPDLLRVFTYRQKKIREMFAPHSDATADKITVG